MTRTSHIAVVAAFAAMILPPGAARGAESFEAAAPPEGWRASGTLEISDEHVKDGERALRWRWSGGDTLTFVDEEALDEAGALSVWIHNAQPADASLTFRFGRLSEVEDGNAPFAFEYPLGFSGWRYCTVDFAQDIAVEGYEGEPLVEAMRIEAPASGSGTIHLDLVQFPPSALWSRPADRQLPFLNPLRDYDWFLRFDDAALSAEAEREATEVELAALREIEARYRTWLLGERADWSSPLVAERSAAFVEKATAAAERLPEMMAKPLVRQQDFGAFFEPLGLLAVGYHMDAPANPMYHDAATADLIVDALNYLHEQGWAAGSLFGDGRVFRLLTGGYSALLFLMKPQLQEAGIWEREQAAARWYSCVGRVFVETDHEGMNADIIRGRYLLSLAWVLTIDDPDDRALWMRRLSEWMSRGLLPAPKWGDTIKPDYTGFHHAMIVGNSYVINALHTAAITQYLLDDTCYEIWPEATEALHEALLAARFYAQKYDVPTMLALRWPFITDSIYRLLPAYAYAALTDDTERQRMARAFRRLWDPTVLEIAQRALVPGAVGYSYTGTIGAVQVVADAAVSGVLAEEAPNGFRCFPYGALAVHRRDEWMVATKGWSRYVSNFEQQQYREGGSGRNIHGRYTSHGTTEIYCAGDPVSREASGYVEQGWDWNRWPGSTAIYLPWHELYEKGPYGRQRNEETFVGGVEHRGGHGLFSMILSDPHHAPGFRALKTYLYAGDRVICLGSNITNDDPEHPVETTLFQLSLGEERAPTYVNSAAPTTALPFEWRPEGDGPVWLIDHVGNGYYVPRPGELRVARQHQVTPWNGVPEPNTEGDFEVAWFDHGPAPDDASYQYMIVIGATAAQMQEIVVDPGYEVLHRSARAHIIHDGRTGITGYALFEAGDVPAGEPIAGVDVPCLIMTRETDAGLIVSVCDPDLGWTDEVERSPVRMVRVTVHGPWRCSAADGVSIVDSTAERTVVEFTCGDGRTREALLLPNA